VVKSGGFDIAWVGYVDESTEKWLVVVASHGDEGGILKTVDFSWGDDENGQAVSSRAIRTGQVQVVNSICEEMAASTWRSQVLKVGYCSAVSVPFDMEEGARACLTAYKKCRPCCPEFESRLVEQVAAQLGFGINTLRTAHAKERFEEQLRTSLEKTIQVVSETIDQRDPYTAGHQRRVADLCTKIATEMQLSPERIRGLHLAATIHDCGKIAIPGEILTRPGRLSPAEFNLLKEHVLRGYEIVKNIDFPWPIPDIVLQHHERMDGSGYPNGLRGEEILLESRIVAVADVFESMNSHRPYRADLGVDVAMNEILKGKGTLYDSDVTDALVRLIRRKQQNETVAQGPVSR
jgi:HD-GYP domain-containing protein (c-di-GMP phosphodiesterase class II)